MKVTHCVLPVRENLEQELDLNETRVREGFHKCEHPFADAACTTASGRCTATVKAKTSAGPTERFFEPASRVRRTWR
ncbi:hypothetical protein EVAR_92485_1 [Eumeta japonica]|uniref:Uncharacterized protein n=1 Tax=Eumeta variegata TaxID=151549 RepID=A0A4C1T6B6_EUMVA|nr:hypothetical protein EVAR_92485_1 [Eumeta japonica]